MKKRCGVFPAGRTFAAEYDSLQQAPRSSEFAVNAETGVERRPVAVVRPTAVSVLTVSW